MSKFLETAIVWQTAGGAVYDTCSIDISMSIQLRLITRLPTRALWSICYAASFSLCYFSCYWTNHLLIICNVVVYLFFHRFSIQLPLFHYLSVSRLTTGSEPSFIMLLYAIYQTIAMGARTLKLRLSLWCYYKNNIAIPISTSQLIMIIVCQSLIMIRCNLNCVSHFYLVLSSFYFSSLCRESIILYTCISYTVCGVEIIQVCVSHSIFWLINGTSEVNEVIIR